MMIVLQVRQRQLQALSGIACSHRNSVCLNGQVYANALILKLYASDYMYTFWPQEARVHYIELHQGAPARTGPTSSSAAPKEASLRLLLLLSTLASGALRV